MPRLLILLLLVGCEAEVEEVPAETTVTFDNRPCPEDSVADWDNFGGPFLLRWCIPCHSSELPDGQRAEAPDDINLETVELARSWDRLLWATAADHNTDMPPAGGPTPRERELLGEWLACGAP